MFTDILSAGAIPLLLYFVGSNLWPIALTTSVRSLLYSYSPNLLWATCWSILGLLHSCWVGLSTYELSLGCFLIILTLVISVRAKKVSYFGMPFLEFCICVDICAYSFLHCLRNLVLDAYVYNTRYYSTPLLTIFYVLAMGTAVMIVMTGMSIARFPRDEDRTMRSVCIYAIILSVIGIEYCYLWKYLGMEPFIWMSLYVFSSRWQVILTLYWLLICVALILFVPSGTESSASPSEVEDVVKDYADQARIPAVIFRGLVRLQLDIIKLQRVFERPLLALPVKRKNVVLRKVFHLAITVILLPSILVRPSLAFYSAIALMVIGKVLCVLELVRAGRCHPLSLSTQLNRFMGSWREEKDSGWFTRTHLYLWLGVMFPLALFLLPPQYAYCSIAADDSAAGIEPLDTSTLPSMYLIAERNLPSAFHSRSLGPQQPDAGPFPLHSVHPIHPILAAQPLPYHTHYHAVFAALGGVFTLGVGDAFAAMVGVYAAHKGTVLRWGTLLQSVEIALGVSQGNSECDALDSRQDRNQDRDQDRDQDDEKVDSEEHAEQMGEKEAMPHQEGSSRRRQKGGVANGKSSDANNSTSGSDVAEKNKPQTRSIIRRSRFAAVLKGVPTFFGLDSIRHKSLQGTLSFVASTFLLSMLVHSLLYFTASSTSNAAFDTHALTSTTFELHTSSGFSNYFLHALHIKDGTFTGIAPIWMPPTSDFPPLTSASSALANKEYFSGHMTCSTSDASSAVPVRVPSAVPLPYPVPYSWTWDAVTTATSSDASGKLGIESINPITDTRATNVFGWHLILFYLWNSLILSIVELFSGDIDNILLPIFSVVFYHFCFH